MTAKDGYFKAKREVVEGIDRRIIFLTEDLKTLESGMDLWGLHVDKVASIKSQIQALEGIRDFVRNVMLWHEENVDV